MEVRYYDDHRGREPVAEYIDMLAQAGETGTVATFFRMVDLLAEHGVNLGMPQSRLINRKERLYELRPRDHRVAYAEHRDEIVLLWAWRKQTRKLDRREAERALSRLADWRKRN